MEQIPFLIPLSDFFCVGKLLNPTNRSHSQLFSLILCFPASGPCLMSGEPVQPANSTWLGSIGKSCQLELMCKFPAPRGRFWDGLETSLEFWNYAKYSARIAFLGETPSFHNIFKEMYFPREETYGDTRLLTGHFWGSWNRMSFQRRFCSSCFILPYFVLLVWDRVLLYSPGWPGARYVDQASLKLGRSSFLCLLNPGITGMHHHISCIFKI